MNAADLAKLDPKAEVLAVRINGKVRILSDDVRAVPQTQSYDPRESRQNYWQGDGPGVGLEDR